MCYYFNPRSHEGSDFCAFCNSVMPFLFQSTLPRGERHSGEISEGNQSDFNPRSHEGSDNFYCPVHPIQCISIHAPTRGATDNDVLGFPSTKISIHAPTRGATNRRVSISIQICISIHAPTRGATWAVLRTKLWQKFQSTLPRGERRCPEQVLKQVLMISIHAPTRGATDPIKES